MKVSVNKNIFKIIIAIVIIVAIAVVAVGVVLPMLQFNQMKNKLSQINAEELETKLIQELEKSKFNVGTVKGITSVEIKKIDGYISVLAYGDGDFDLIKMQVLKVDSDNNGNFKGIEYIPVFDFRECIDIDRIIFNVLENEFDVKGLNYKNREKLTQHNMKKLSFTFTNDETLLLYINEINTRAEDYKSVAEIEKEANQWNRTDYFGINTNN